MPWKGFVKSKKKIMELSKEMKDLIERDLPKQTGEVLRSRLEEANQLELKVKSLEASNDSYSKRLEEALQKVSKLEATVLKEKELLKREEEFNKEKNQFEIDKLKYQLESEKEKTAFTKDVALGLVRNTVYRKNIFDSETQSPYHDSNGNWHYPQPIVKSFTETKNID